MTDREKPPRCLWGYWRKSSHWDTEWFLSLARTREEARQRRRNMAYRSGPVFRIAAKGIRPPPRSLG